MARTGLALAVGVVAVAVLVAGWQGTDLAAQVFRSQLVQRQGFAFWNNHWYGGHHTVGYGVLTPVLSSIVGLGVVAVASAALSAVLADDLITTALGRRSWPASLWFAAGTITNVLVGRVPFALGMTIGLAALVAAQRRRFVVAGVLALLTATASAVASAFLGLIFIAWALTSDRGGRARPAILAAAALAPVGAVMLAYPQGGTFPFRWSALAATIAVSAAVVALVPARYRMVRTAAVLYAASALVLFVVPSAVGANGSRLAMYAGGPVLLALVSTRRLAMGGAVALIGLWQWSPAPDAVSAADEPSSDEEFYEPLLAYLDDVGVDELHRIEVVPTRNHWESAYVALEIPIARGWERQLDRRFNEIFYEESFTAGQYERWLHDTGVTYVALADAPLDTAGELEADLLETGLDFLRPAWSSDDWQVWEVVDSPDLVDDPAEVIELSADHVVVDVDRGGDIEVRVRSSSYWETDPPVCVEATEEGWIELLDVEPGVIEIFRDERPLGATATPDPCE
jgi:hypothetical protein